MTVNGATQAVERPVIRLFGPLSIELCGRRLGPGDLGGARPKQVLEILLAARGHRVPTDRLADLLWGQQAPQNAAGSLQTFVSVLRRNLVPDRGRARELVVTEAEAYRFATDRVELDLDRFDALIEAAAHEPTKLARRSLKQALALVRGDLLEDEPYAGWSQELRATYRGRVLGAHVEAADAALAELDYAAALVYAEAAAAFDPFSERAHRSRMLALYAVGRQHDALDSYRRFRARLDDELGLEPTSETRGLEAAILRQDDVRSLLPRPIVHAADGDARRSMRLLGRSAELGALDRAVREALDGSVRLILVEADAGLGKTRLLDELATSLIGVLLGRAGASELEQHLPYVPLAAALRDAVPGIGADRGVSPGLQRILPELPASAVELSEVDALESLVELVASHAPLVLLIDDLHWADPATVAALSYLQRRCTGVPLALVATMGSEHAPPEHPARRLRPNLALRLEPLTAAELAPLGLPDLHASTGGNPRFVAAAIADDAARGLDDALAETLLTQCRAEGAWGYRVLLGAAVLDQPFGPEPLAAVLDAELGELVEELDRLCERRILRVEGPRFAFRYSLVRDVLLDSLSPARRRLLLDRLAAHEQTVSRTTIRAVGSQGV